MIPRNNLQFNHKVEFSSFDGKDPKGWIKKCTRYFGLCRINEHQKMDLAALHFKGPAEIWSVGYIIGRRNVTWDDFIVDICSRFRDNLAARWWRILINYIRLGPQMIIWSSLKS